MSNISYKTWKITTMPFIPVKNNRISNRLAIQIKSGYKLESKTPKTMKLFGNTKELIEYGENMPSLEVVLVQCKLLGDQYQQRSVVLYIFMPIISHTYLFNVKPSNLVFLKTYNTEFDEIIGTFADRNGGPLRIKEKLIWHCL